MTTASRAGPAAPPAPPGPAAPERAVVIIVDRGIVGSAQVPRYSVGSGYLVGGAKVLIAPATTRSSAARRWAFPGFGSGTCRTGTGGSATPRISGG